MSLTVALFCATGVLLFLSISSTLLRCYVRVVMLKSFGLDDYLMVAALFSYIVTESCVFYGVAITHDKSILELLQVVGPAMKSMYLGEIFYVITVLLLKLSIGTFLLRLFQKPYHKHIIYGVLAVVSVYSATYFFLVVFQCNPVSHFWAPFGKGTCLSGTINTYTSYAHGAVIGTSDLIFAFMPLLLVWNLQMNFAMKFSVAGLLGLGALAGITTFIRMPYVKALAEAELLDFFPVTSRLGIWTCVEPGVGIFIGSLAALRPLFRSILGGSGIFSGSGSRSQGGQNASNSRTRYWPSSSQQKGREDALHLESFGQTNRRCISTVTTGKSGKGGLGRGDSEEALTLGKGSVSVGSVGTFGAKEEGIHRTVEFKATSESARSTPTSDEDYKSRGGFY